MITAGQYPTGINWPLQNFEATELITALNIDDPELTDSYWLGWISYDNLPSAFKISRQSIDTEAGTMSFADVTRPENVDIAIISPASTSSDTGFNNPYTSIYAGDVWRPFDTISGTNVGIPSTQARFINRFDVNTIVVANAYFVVNMSIDDAVMAQTIVTMNPAELYDRHFTRTITSSIITYVRGSSVPSGLSFDISDDMLDGTLQTLSVSGHTIKFFVGGFGISYVNRPITTAGSAGNYYNALPVVRLHDGDDHTFLIGGSRFYVAPTGWSGGGYRITPSTGAINASDFYDAATGTCVGGFDGTISFDDILAVSGNGVYGVAASNGNFAVQGVGDDRFAIVRRMYSWYDIITTLSYMMRYSPDRTYDTDDTKYYPAISDSNEFLGYLLNGATDRDELRPWQISGTALDAESDEYKPSDKPIYIPPDPDDRDKIGDSIDFNRTFPTGSATGLFTLYALRQVHVSKLGAKLWATLNDPDQNFWQNLQFAIGAFAETGSADISSVLEYITSIRIYPFALINLPGYTNAGTGAIRLGTGRVALDLGTEGAGNVGIMGQYTGLIDAGSAYIPQHFEDFRDLENVTISVYLPYIGNIQLNPAEVTGCTIAAEYAVDLTSGSCVAYLLLSGRWGYYPIGIYSGTIGADIPLTASQGNRLFSRQIAAAISPILASSSALQTESQNDAAGVNFSSAVAAARTAVQAVEGLTGSSLTPPVLNGGGANFTGFGAPQTAYIQIRRAQYAYTARSFPSATFGNRTAQRATIGSLSGFTRCINPDVSKIPAPAAIQQSIKAKLESGVYI